ncbi:MULTISPECIES: YHYH protein [unclassified Psychrosphaera]|uniref:YHYH protein n=1 Tax=unclassified Psychrosphaera TaxID=2641570 RepID=UPI002091CC39|nr:MULTISPECIES: YHYH protein [unclassified Psychrosphaera]
MLILNLKTPCCAELFSTLPRLKSAALSKFLGLVCLSLLLFGCGSDSSEPDVEVPVEVTNSAVTGTVTIHGSLDVGEALSITQTLTDGNGLGDFSYQWMRNGNDIIGATNSTYTLVQEDVGFTLSVVITFVDGDGFNETATSAGRLFNDPQASNDKPNILLIISDDQGIDASAQYPYSNDAPVTPTLNSLAQSGIVFENVWATPACTTTRGSIITGQHGVNSGITYVPAKLDSSSTTLQSYIKTLSGGSVYQTAVFGKWHLGGGNPDDTHPNDSGVDHFAGNISNLTDYYNWSLTENGETTQSSLYHTTQITDLAIDWIAQQNGNNTPWFTWLAYSAPHTPLHLPPSDLHQRTTLTGTDNDINSKPREYFLAAIEAMDSEIGRLLNSMSQADLDNTLVIFIGDNGTSAKVLDNSVFSRSNNKGSLGEGGVRVPMVASGKGVTRQNVREAALINSTDLFATISSVVKGDVIQYQNSYSVSELFTSEDAGLRSYNYTEYESDNVTGWAVRNDEYKLVELADGTQSLFHVVNDLDENNDLINDSQYASIVTELAQYAAVIRGEQSAGPIDITDMILTSRSGNCVDYVESYESTVLDVNNSTVFNGDLEISVVGDKCLFATNMIPNHDFNDGVNAFPNQVSAQDETFEITTSPSHAATITDLTLMMDNALMLNGVKVDLIAAACYNVGNEKIGCNDMSTPWRFDPVYIPNGFRVDSHNAHTQPDGSYHYHGNPNALFWDGDDTVVSPVIGFAADGYPIFGSYFDDNGVIRKAQSSFKLKAGSRPSDASSPGGTYDGTYRDDYEYTAGAGDLDECNGMTVDGVYGYFVTDGYPYVMSCFKGTPDPSFYK